MTVYSTLRAFSTYNTTIYVLIVGYTLVHDYQASRRFQECWLESQAGLNAAVGRYARPSGLARWSFLLPELPALPGGPD
jgi:hypothetical protein